MAKKASEHECKCRYSATARIEERTQTKSGPIEKETSRNKDRSEWARLRTTQGTDFQQTESGVSSSRIALPSCRNLQLAFWMPFSLRNASMIFLICNEIIRKQANRSKYEAKDKEKADRKRTRSQRKTNKSSKNRENRQSRPENCKNRFKMHYRCNEKRKQQKHWWKKRTSLCHR